MGDFNAIRNQSDRLGGSTTWAGTMDRLDTFVTPDIVAALKIIQSLERTDFWHPVF